MSLRNRYSELFAAIPMVRIYIYLHVIEAALRPALLATDMLGISRRPLGSFKGDYHATYKMLNVDYSGSFGRPACRSRHL